MTPATGWLAAGLASLALGLAGAAPATAEDPPPTSGTAAVVIDARNGDVMHGRAGRARRPVASATKLMTALLTLERADLDDKMAAVAYDAAPIESKIDLRRGERMTVRDLLTALLLESANDAAATLAARIAGSRAAFVREMNRRAVELGLRDTSFANPIGFDDPHNHSSARDLAALARRLMENEAFAQIVDMPRAVLRSGSRRRTIDNRNRLVVRYPFVTGVKTGHTRGAGYVLVGSAAGNGGHVIAVTLGAPTEAARDTDTLALLQWGVDRFRREQVVGRRQVLARASIRYQDGRARLGAGRRVRLVLREGQRTRTVVDAPDEVEGPLEAGEQVGWAEVRREGQVVRRVPLVTLEAVPAADIRDRLRANAGYLLTGLALLAIVVFGMIAMMRRRAAR